MGFSEIKGQENAIKVLERYLAGGRMQGGYLFSGPEGVGKKMAAISLAMALNCARQDNSACGECSSCRRIAAVSHPDVRIIPGEAAEIKIEEIHELRREISFKPYEAEVKVFIVDNAHKLNSEASNCLLKVLEEPPSRSLMILVSDKPAVLLRTIVSRCRQVKFSPLRRGLLEEMLYADYGLDRHSAHFLAYFSDGSLGRALRGKEKGLFFRRNELLERFLLLPRPRMDALQLRDKEDKEELRDILMLMAAWFRDIYFLKSGMADSEAINADRREDLLREAPRFSLAQAQQALGLVAEGVFLLEHKINPKLLLSVLGAQLWKQ
jgi:DNA polymerase-3 subunit delta'